MAERARSGHAVWILGIIAVFLVVMVWMVVTRSEDSPFRDRSLDNKEGVDESTAML